MTKTPKISKTLSSLSNLITPKDEPTLLLSNETPITDTPKDPNEGTILEGSTGQTDNPLTNGTTETKEPEETKLEPTPIPLSKRMDELMILTLQDGYRTSGTHPDFKKTPKWMINPKFNGRERWMDLTKITGWNIPTGQIILTRSEIQHRGMEQFISEPYNETKHSEFTLRK